MPRGSSRAPLSGELRVLGWGGGAEEELLEGRGERDG